MSIKIAMTNEKGGCAKTTTAVNLAAILAEQGFKTLIVDMDYQSYATHYLDRYNEELPGILETLEGQPVTNIIRNSEFEYLDILPSTISFSAGEEMLTHLKLQSKEYLPLLENALAPISGRYDYIIIDCPPNGVHLKEIIQAYADYLILPTIPDDYAVHSLLCKAQEMIKIKGQINPHLEILGVLVVMYERNKNKAAYTEALKEQNFFPCFDTVIRKNTTLSEAINAKQPVIHYNKRCNGTVDYKAFAAEVINLTKGVK